MDRSIASRMKDARHAARARRGMARLAIVGLLASAGGCTKSTDQAEAVEQKTSAIAVEIASILGFESTAGWRAPVTLASSTTHSQGARSLELRAAVSLTRAANTHEQIAESRRRLALLFESFTEGRDTPDLREATVFYTVWGDENMRADTAVALESAKGVIRSAVGRGTGLKHTPSLSFIAEHQAITSAAGRWHFWRPLRSTLKQSSMSSVISPSSLIST